MGKVTIPPDIKLKAIAMKYYQHMKWEPKVGDLYCIVRADNEVFEIVDMTKHGVEPAQIHIKSRTHRQDYPTIFPKRGFTTKDFGKYRVYIHPVLHELLTEQPHDQHD